MPLIKSDRHDATKEAWRIRLQRDICKEILAYCEWANIKYRDHFIQQACLFILENDEEWARFKKIA